MKFEGFDKQKMKEVREALIIIQETCANALDCQNCPLYINDYECGIHDAAPVHWAISDDDDSPRLLEGSKIEELLQ